VTDTATPPPTPIPGRPRRRPNFRLVEVQAVHRLTPRLVSVALGGESLAGFEVTAPTQHIKVLFPAAGQDEPAVPQPGPDGLVWPEDQPRPVMRTYTPRRWDPATGTLDVEFVLHGVGPASEWAEQAEVGDRIAIAGPGGRLSLDLENDAGRYVVAGDESAIPAIATLLEAIPAGAGADVYVEVAGPEDELALPAGADTTVTWLPRRAPDAWGVELDDAVGKAELTDETMVWVACEAAAVRRIRRRLLSERNHPAAQVVTRGYWRLGEQNHPDHDYGEDA
jgi:NADPH-dependent ferric siderophore reductase